MRLPHVLPTAAAGALLLLTACGSDGDPDPVVLTGSRVTTTTDTTVPEADSAAPEEDPAAAEAAPEDDGSDGEATDEVPEENGETAVDGEPQEVPDETAEAAVDEGAEDVPDGTPEDAVNEAPPQDAVEPDADAGGAADGAGP